MMAIRPRDCDANRLRGFLDDRLESSEQVDLAGHLESCDPCRRKLDALAGGPAWWEGVREFLGTATEAHPSGSDGEDRDGATPDDPERLQKLGPYQVRGVIGRGGMGVVLKGFDSALNRFVAIKVLAPELATSGAARRRFAREAKAAAAVAHEHVIAIHTVDADGRLPYLVMPYVGGESLQERIDRVGPLEPTEILRIGMQIASGLAAAHAQGLVHRDIKPANILLENGVERVKITDFGLARAFDAGLTQSGVIVGTPQYMAPEQAAGDLVDHRADLFSLGSVLYAMSTGLAPFRAETSLGVLRRVIDELPRAILEINPEIPDWLAGIIQRLHAKNPNDRPASAVEVATLLGHRLAELQQPAPPPPPRRASRVVVGGLFLVLIAALALGVADVPGAIASWRALFAVEPDARPPAAREIVPPPIEPESATPQSPEIEPEALALATVAPQRKASYDGTFREAYEAGLAHLRLKELDKSRKALEEALKLAPGDADRVKTYRALLPSYRALSDVTQTFEALEFLIRHAESSAERSLARTSLLSAAHERGKVRALVKRYEEKLKKDPNDRASLYILSDVYDRLSPNPERGAEITKRLADLDKRTDQGPDLREEARRASQLVRAGKLTEGAELFEEVAKADPKLSAWHYKEAAVAWRKAKNSDRALKAALASLASAPEDRGALLEYFWRRSLGDVFLDSDRPDLAISQYEAALSKTDIAGYLSETRQKLSEARSRVSPSDAKP